MIYLGEFMKYFVFIVLFFLLACSEAKNKPKENKKVTLKKKPEISLPKLISTKKIDGREYKYHSLSMTISKKFKEKDKNLFFSENGTNLTIKAFLLPENIEEYINKNFAKLKSDYSETIDELNRYNINGKKAYYVKHIIDRKKYLIQIESVLIKDKSLLYAVNIAGKKTDIEKLGDEIKAMFASIKIKNDLTHIDR